MTHRFPANGALDGRLPARLAYLVAFLVYQAIALGVWWHLLARGLASSIPAGSTDPGEEVWFLAWVPHALGAGTNPFFSNAVFAPDGINLLANTSTELVGLLLSPLTATVGPMASFGVAVLVAPSLSALSAFALSRRYVSRAPAAFAGGLCYGFGAFLTTDLRFGHLDLTWLMLPPLIFLALDEILVRRRRNPASVGAVLGALVVAQFFISTEILAVTAITAATAVGIAALARPRAVLPALRAGWVGLAAATGIVLVVLAYPFWVVVAGPGHIVGPVWPHICEASTSLAATVEPHAELAAVGFISGGNGSYLGIPLLVVLVVGSTVLWHRSPDLRMAIALAVIAYVVSLGYDLHVGQRNLHLPLPATLLGHVPLLDSIAPERFAAMVDLFVGVALAIVLDHTARPQQARSPGGLHLGLDPRTPRVPRRAAAAVVAGVALLPMWLAAPWPYPTVGVVRPAALRAPSFSVAAASPTPIVLVYPDSANATSDQMLWQAEEGFAFSLPDGYAIVPGAHGHAVQVPPDDALWTILAGGTLGRLRLPLSTAAEVAVRDDLRSLGVSEVVVLPGARGSDEVRSAMTAVLGPIARRLDGAAVWLLSPAQHDGR